MEFPAKLLLSTLLVLNPWLFSAKAGISQMESAKEIFHVASNADFVAIGTIKSEQPTGKRLSDKELRELGDIGNTLGGVLYTLKVETLLCAKTDFTPGIRRPVLAGKDLFIFKKRDTSFFREESYRLNQRYLMYFSALPEQAKLPAEYNLAEGRTYYEAFEGKKGLIPLPNSNSPLVNKLKTFCNALSPLSGKQKISRLQALANSSDAELSASAKEAITTLKNN